MGDTRGPPQDHDTAESMRKFETSSNLYRGVLFERMIAEKLLGVDDERGVIMAAKGPRFFTRYR